MSQIEKDKYLNDKNIELNSRLKMKIAMPGIAKTLSLGFSGFLVYFLLIKLEIIKNK